MRWRNLDEGQKVYCMPDGTIVGRVIEKPDGQGAYHILPPGARENKNTRRLIGFFPDVEQAKKAVEKVVAQAAA